MQWLEKSSGFTQVQGLGSFKSTLTRLYATHHSFSLPEPCQIKPRALGVILSTSKSRRLGCCNSGDVLDQKTTLTQYICWCLSFHYVWINFLGFIVGLISRCCSRRASVERSLCLKWLTMSFSTSSIPAILLLNFADDALQVTSPKAPFCVQNFFLEAPSLQPGRERYTATTLRCSMAKATVAVVSGRLTSRSLSATCSPVWLPRKTTSPSKRIKSQFKSSSTKFAHLVAKGRWSVRCKGDWKEIAKLNAKYSIFIVYSRSTTTRLCCSCFFRSYAVRWRGSSGLRLTRRFTVADLRRYTFFFLLNECSLSQNECLWPLQTNFYRTFGRFVSALLLKEKKIKIKKLYRGRVGTLIFLQNFTNAINADHPVSLKSNSRSLPKVAFKKS